MQTTSSKACLALAAALVAGGAAGAGAQEKKLLTEAQIADILNPTKLTNLDKSLYIQKKK